MDYYNTEVVNRVLSLISSLQVDAVIKGDFERRKYLETKYCVFQYLDERYWNRIAVKAAEYKDRMMSYSDIPEYVEALQEKIDEIEDIISRKEELIAEANEAFEAFMDSGNL